MACTAITGGITAAAFLIFMGAIAWTIAYDTIYARQDVEDDIRLGLKSTAILFADNIRLCVVGFMIIAFGFLVMAGISSKAFGSYYAVLALPALHAFITLRNWRENDAQSCLATFKAQRDFALLVLLALLFI
jgi:4-hydroxybenzoate polyprenyltransferase